MKKLMIILLGCLPMMLQAQNAKFCKSYSDFVANRWTPVESLTEGRTNQMCQVKFEDDQFKFSTGDKEADEILKKEVLVVEYMVYGMLQLVHKPFFIRRKFLTVRFLGVYFFYGLLVSRHLIRQQTLCNFSQKHTRFATGVKERCLGTFKQFLREHIKHAVHHLGRRKHFIVAQVCKATQDIGIMLVYHLAIVSCNQRCTASKNFLRHLALQVQSLHQCASNPQRCSLCVA